MVELPAAARKDAAELAERILSSAGSGLRHYTTANRERIMYEAAAIIDAIKPVVVAPAPVVLKTPDQLTMQRIIQIAVLSGFNVKTAQAGNNGKWFADTSALNTFARLLVSDVVK